MVIKHFTNFGGTVLSVFRADTLVGEVSGFEAVIHCGDELLFGVGMEV